MRARMLDLVGFASEIKKLDKLVFAIANAQTASRKGEPVSHQQLFGELGDFQWWWMNTTGYRRLRFVRSCLPSLPDPVTQRNFIGKSGDHALREAFNAYRIFKSLTAKHSRAIGRDSSVLDFGCGWGRILRFFMRDLAPGNLFGADVMPLALELSRKTNRWATFEQVSSVPPSTFSADKFDLIYLYSVFSHLSEASHDAWLTEFRRILRPGGVLIATTWPRAYIADCELKRKTGNASAHEGAKLSFVGTREWERRYDLGEYCHSAVGGGAALDSEFYGETCIPEAYARARWADRFEICEYVTNHPGLYQDLIVARKPLRNG